MLPTISLFVALNMIVEQCEIAKVVPFLIRVHPLNTYAKFSEKLTFLTVRIMELERLVFRQILTCAYQGVKNVSFSENVRYVLNE